MIISIQWSNMVINRSALRHGLLTNSAAAQSTVTTYDYDTADLLLDVKAQVGLNPQKHSLKTPQCGVFSFCS